MLLVDALLGAFLLFTVLTGLSNIRSPARKRLTRLVGMSKVSLTALGDIVDSAAFDEEEETMYFHAIFKGRESHRLFIVSMRKDGTFGDVAIERNGIQNRTESLEYYVANNVYISDAQTVAQKLRNEDKEFLGIVPLMYDHLKQHRVLASDEIKNLDDSSVLVELQSWNERLSAAGADVNALATMRAFIVGFDAAGAAKRAKQKVPTPQVSETKLAASGAQNGS